jgi:hypothetical protein
LKEGLLLTTLLDAKAHPKSDIAKIYRMRWNVEIASRDNKDTFGLDRINANSPGMYEKIIWAHVLAYNVLRRHMLNACALFEVELENVSVTAAATVLTVNTPLILATSPEDRPRLFSFLYLQVIQVPVGKCPGREKPRGSSDGPSHEGN